MFLIDGLSNYFAHSACRLQTIFFHFHAIVCLHRILSHSKVHDWGFVSTKINPADKLTRGMTASALIKDDFWCSGRRFLQLSPDKWPIVLKVKLTEEVYRCYDLNVQKNVETSFSKGSCLASVSSPSPCCLHTGKQKSTLLHPTCQLIVHFSSFYRLKLAVCWLNRFKTYLLIKVRSKGLTRPPVGPIMVNELSKAENSIIGYGNRHAFP